MRSVRLLLASTIVLSLALSTAAVSPAAATEPPSPFFSESIKPIDQDRNVIPITGHFGLPGGSADIIWYAPGRAVDELWISDEAGGFTKTDLSKPVNGHYIPVVGNFSGDQRDDIFWYGSGRNHDSFWNTDDIYHFKDLPVSVNGTYTPVVIPDTITRDDILWWNKSGPSYVWSFTGSGAAHVDHTITPPPGTRPIVGDFDGDGYGDIFWYAPGRTPDALWSGNGAGQYVERAQTVNGTYNPIVNNFTPTIGGPQDDILWYQPNGSSILWQNRFAGEWTSTAHSIPAGMPVPASGDFGVLYVVRPGAPDWVWHLTFGSDADYSSPSHNTEIGSGYTPLVDDFAGDGNDIFWYKPGPAPEHLFYLNLVAR